ncbi:ATP-binding cassette domain-containing protein [uncultured Tateyamaria sp.]|uniref:ATP-binding cassette domain-containing protein n=1 Tax=uncultured Tateyamaria sp. TaxID=455651 RepID=UPI00262C13B4|nr:ATP-binding cassette domain-containing protein [uncultured Tateyamaria sp.]
MIFTATGLSAIRSGRTILHPTDVDIRPCERVGLVGASGSGKSTLGHALIDTLRAQGVRVAHVPQSPDEALDPLRSMDFHWCEAERALGLTHDASRQKKLITTLRIEGGDLHKRPWGWSRGMQQRFVIAMALIGTLDLLVMDEPTSALDPVVAADTMDLLDRYLTERQTAFLLITHDLGLAARRVARVIVMDDGRIVEDAPTEQFLLAPVTQAAKSLCAHRNWLELPC